MHSLSRVTTPIYRVIIMQGIVAIVCALVALWFGVVAAYSALLGGVVCVVPELIMARHLLSTDSLRGGLFGGFISKLMMTLGLFIIIFIGVKALNVVALFTTLVIVQHAQLFSSNLTK